MKKAIYTYATLIFLLMLVAGVTFAAFTDTAKILGSTFSVGSADIKLLDDVTAGVDVENLIDEKTGPTFSNITPNWSEDYLVKIYNNATADVSLTTNANYETANDPDELRSVIYVEPFEWNDSDSDGELDDGELGISLGRKTITKWKTEGFDLGALTAGSIKSLVLRLSTDDLSDTKQGKSGIFDFEFDAVSL